MDEPAETPTTEPEEATEPVRLSVAELADCSRLGQSWRRIDLLACRPHQHSMMLGDGMGFMGYDPSILV